MICADEKRSIQARKRKHATPPARPGDEQIAAPFQSNYPRDDLNKLLTKTDTTAPASAAA